LASGGFGPSNPEALEAAIRRAIEQTEATIDPANEHGAYYNAL